MPYEITATRKRPQNFDQLEGQEFVSATLVASLKSGRIAHAYLFSGPRGCGKTSTARILAKALNCERGPTPQPCGICRSCVEITRGASLDVIEIDGASNTSVDNVRQIKDEVLFPPNGGHYKVYIIDEVHMLSNSAFNALLKTIEEPPPYIVFIFATTELHKVPATIKSRCQQFAFRLFKVELIKTMLATAAEELGIEAEDEALLWIAKESGGSLRDAYTLFDQVLSFAEGKLTSALIRDRLGLTGFDALGGLFAFCAAGDAGAAFSAVDEILTRGVSPEQLASEAAEYCRSLLLIKNGITKAGLLGAPVSSYDAVALNGFTSECLERALAGLLDLYRNLRYSVDSRFELELAIAKLCRLADYVSPTELVRTVSALRRYVGSDAAIGSFATSVAAATEAQKKKPELPPQLSAAFDSFAATAKEALTVSRVQESAVTEKVKGEGDNVPKGLIARDASSQSRVLSESTEEGESEDDDVAYISSTGEGLAFSTEASTAIGWNDESLRGAVIDALGRSSLLLKMGLASSLPWRIEETRLVIPFRSGMEESVVRGSIADIAAKASELIGKPLRVELKVESSSKREAVDAPVHAGPDPISIVERVFRGTRIPNGGRGASDEFR